jgi:hypothetical protein
MNNFLLGYEIAKQFVSEDRAYQLAIIPALMDESQFVSALLITDFVAKRESASTLPPVSNVATMPDVTGVSVDAALQTLQIAGLAMTREDVPSTGVEINLVIRQAPTAGTPINPQTQTVTVFVSSASPTGGQVRTGRRQSHEQSSD